MWLGLLQFGRRASDKYVVADDSNRVKELEAENAALRGEVAALKEQLAANNRKD